MKILIVEDEGLTREWIKKKVEEIDSDYKAVCFEDARSALEFLRENSVDVIFTDIRLPIMNGLEFLNEIQERNIDAYKIILSAYDEFDYAREAMKIGIKEFLLKTEITKGKLKEVLSSVEKSINSRNTDVVDSNSILYSPNVKISDIYNFLEFYGLSHDINKKMCVLLHFEKDISKIEIEDFINQYLAHNGFNAWHEKSGLYEYIIIFDVSLRMEQIGKLKFSLDSFIGKNIYMGISSFDHGEYLIEKRNKNPLAELRRKAELAVENRLFFRDTSYINYRDMYVFKEEDSLELCFNEEKLNILILINENNYRVAYSKLSFLFDKVKSSSYLSVGYVKNLFNEILRAYYHAGEELLEEGDKAKYSELMEKIFVGNSENIYIIEEQILTLISEFTKKTESNIGIRRYSETTTKILSYINDNYKSQAIVSELSSKLFFSRNYISALFKKDTGTTISRYITEVRLCKAKQLLLGTSLSISEIALDTGYFDISHFSRVFKEEYGDSPLEYRKKYTKTS